jgi:KaiC/GvpD/RAD55 family RecA-like ATPase
MDARLELRNRLRAIHPLIAIQTLEEERTILEIVRMLEQEAAGLEEARAYDIFQWDVINALRPIQSVTPALLPGKKKDVRPLLDIVDRAISTEYAGHLVIFVKDAYEIFIAPTTATSLRRVLKTMVNRDPERKLYLTVILLDHTMPAHPTLEEDMVAIEWPLPTREELGECFSSEALLSLVGDELREGLAFFDDDVKAGSECESALEHIQNLADAAQGLKMSEAKHAFVLAFGSEADLGGVSPRHIVKAKEQLIGRSGLLTFHQPEGTLADVGGLDLLKGWLRERRRAFGPDAAAFGLPSPKAVLLVGPPGTGKSIVPRLVGAEWGMPVLQLDMGQLMNSMLGQSEANLRDALRTAEAAAPAILWFDEIEKAIGTGGDRDGGTSGRILATWLTWMAEKEAPVFVIASANDPLKLPAEVTRVGRFDRTFYVGFPNTKERAEIFAVHLRKRGRDPDDFNLQLLASRSDGFSGAEIEGAIIGALFKAFDRNAPDVEMVDLLDECAGLTPLSVSNAEQLRPMIEWAESNAKHASVHDTPATVASGGRGRSRVVSRRNRLAMNKKIG